MFLFSVHLIFLSYFPFACFISSVLSGIILWLPFHCGLICVHAFSDNSYAFVYREVHRSSSLANGSALKRKSGK